MVLVPTDSDLTTSGRRVRFLRRDVKGWSQSYLGSRVGASQVAVSHWERDRYTPTIAMQRALAEALDTTRTFLLFDTEERAAS